MDARAVPQLAAEGRVEQGQQCVLGPLAVQVLSILALPQAAIDELVAAKVAGNALLLAGDAPRCRWCGAHARGGRCLACTGVLPRSPHRDVMAAESVFERLRRDARVQAPARLGPAIDMVIASLDERGLLPPTVDEMAASLPGSVDDVVAAIDAIRAVGPPGLAAHDVLGSLELQSIWHVERGAPHALTLIVPTFLAEVAVGDHRSIGDRLGLPVHDVVEAVDFLRRRLRPYPVFEEAGAVDRGTGPPDIIIRPSVRSPGALIVDVLDAADVGLRLDDEVLRAGCVGDESTRRWVAERRIEATGLLDLLDRRAATLRSVAKAVVTAQAEFVLKGEEHHRPLTRTEIADILGIHLSTVSRAVQGKVVRLPDGRVVPLASFFGRSVAAKVALGELLRSRCRHTDAELAAELATAGYRVARRTVAKYRREIANSDAALT